MTKYMNLNNNTTRMRSSLTTRLLFYAKTLTRSLFIAITIYRLCSENFGFSAESGCVVQHNIVNALWLMNPPYVMHFNSTYAGRIKSIKRQINSLNEDLDNHVKVQSVAMLENDLLFFEHLNEREGGENPLFGYVFYFGKLYNVTNSSDVNGVFNVNSRVLSMASPNTYGFDGCYTYIRTIENKILRKDIGRKARGIDDLVTEYPFDDWVDVYDVILDDCKDSLDDIIADSEDENITRNIKESYITKCIIPYCIFKFATAIIDQRDVAFSMPVQWNKMFHDHISYARGDNLLGLIKSPLYTADLVDSVKKQCEYFGYTFVFCEHDEQSFDKNKVLFIATPKQYGDSMNTYIVYASGVFFYVKSIDLGKTCSTPDIVNLLHNLESVGDVRPSVYISSPFPVVFQNLATPEIAPEEVIFEKPDDVTPSSESIDDDEKRDIEPVRTENSEAEDEP